jgi:mannose-6-phosphate isomerase-like protein (cupin superfamily)
MNGRLRAGVNGLRGGSVIDIGATRESLERAGGGLQIAHTSAAFEIRVEVFNSPGPGELRVEDRDVLYIALDGSGVLGLESDDVLSLVPGEATVVPARTKHIVFGNPRVSLLTVSSPGWTVS